MLHTKFRGNRPAGSVEEDFKGFLPAVGNLGHVIRFSFVPEAFIKNLVQICKVVSEKIRLNFVCTRP